MYTILLVDDDSILLEANKQYFESGDYHVFCAATAKKAQEIIRTTQLDCIVLDVDLPDGSGFDLCTDVRKFTSIPIVFLSAYTEEESRIRGLTIGGDDYVCKPFYQKELEIRVRMRILRRYENHPAARYEFDGLIVDAGSYTVTYHDKKGDFSRLEFEVLLFFAEHPGRIYSYEQLYDSIWKEPLNESRHNLQARVARVRLKLRTLCPDREYIRTIRHKGYQFMP